MEQTKQPHAARPFVAPSALFPDGMAILCTHSVCRKTLNDFSERYILVATGMIFDRHNFADV